MHCNASSVKRGLGLPRSQALSSKPGTEAVRRDGERGEEGGTSLVPSHHLQGRRGNGVVDGLGTRIIVLAF